MRRPAASGVSALSSFVAKGRQALHKAKAQRVPNLLCWSFFPCRLPCPAGPTVADCSISVDGSLRLVSILTRGIGVRYIFQKTDEGACPHLAAPAAASALAVADTQDSPPMGGGRQL